MCSNNYKKGKKTQDNYHIYEVLCNTCSRPGSMEMKASLIKRSMHVFGIHK